MSRVAPRRHVTNRPLIDTHQTGGVTLRTPTETARSQYAIYDLPRGIVTMIGGVNLDQGSNHVQGGRLVLDLDTHRAVLDGGGRVTGRFTVPRRQGN